jgi:quercetin dioxygenase-like cupin family protein
MTAPSRLAHCACYLAAFAFTSAGPLRGQDTRDIMNGSGPGKHGANCRPVTSTDNESATKFGCWIMAHAPQGVMHDSVVYWRVFMYSNGARPDTVHDRSGTIVEGLGKTWLFSIGKPNAPAPRGTVRVADIGPLHVTPGLDYTARYMVAVFKPGMTSSVHRHPGPEAWYTLSGEVCLETPDGIRTGRRGESTIVPAGPPMKLTAVGTEIRRSLVLVLHESDKPAGIPASDWRPKGLCR